MRATWTKGKTGYVGKIGPHTRVRVYRKGIDQAWRVTVQTNRAIPATEYCKGHMVAYEAVAWVKSIVRPAPDSELVRVLDSFRQ